MAHEREEVEHHAVFGSADLETSLTKRFIKSEISEIIYALICREYIMWNDGSKTRKARPKLFDEPEEQKATFSQPVTALQAKRTTNVSIPKMHSSMSASKS
jgi:hypothetical protein